MNMRSLQIIPFYFSCVIASSMVIIANEDSSEINSNNSTGINDLLVEAQIYDRHSLQLEITWNSSSIKDGNINVNVKPLKTEYCQSRPCFEYGLRPTTNKILLPMNPMSHVQDSECSIKPGCVYEIIVDASKQNALSNITYLVPDCIVSQKYNVCSCHHQMELPTVILAASIDASKIYILYNITSTHVLPNDIIIDYVTISVGKQNNPSLPWGGEISNSTTLTEQIYNQSSSGKAKIPFTLSSSEGSHYLIRAHVIDNRGCEGKDSYFSLDVPIYSQKELTHPADLNFKKIIIIIIPAVLITLLIIVLMRTIIKRVKKQPATQNWRVYHHVSSSYGGVPHIAMQENLLYIDKDILEARCRGEADYLEVPHSCLTIGREIGKGAFGRVFIARADNLFGKPGTQIVAVKQLKKKPTQDELDEFHSEIDMMKNVSKHENIVSLLACCTIKQPLLMIMEYVGCGDLLQYLREVRAKHEARSIVVSGILNSVKISQELLNGNQIIPKATSLMPNGKYLQLLHSSSTTSASDASYITQSDTLSGHVRPSVTETMYTILSHNPDVHSTSHSSLEYVLDHKELHNFATQIARGMNHLEERQITHRDLAARNILISENKVLKISDFGLSRSGIYVNTRNKKVPLRWLSIEAIRDNLYSSKSDVWAFAVVLWEIGTLGGFPYPTIGNHELLSFLTSGQRLQRPENCSENLYALMLKCWTERPEQRPRFSEILTYLEPSNQKIYVDFNELSSDYVFPPTKEQLQQTNGITQVKLRH